MFKYSGKKDGDMDVCIGQSPKSNGVFCTVVGNPVH